jgi:hypothetical protein
MGLILHTSQLLYEFHRPHSVLVMAGLVPAIHVLLHGDRKDVDARHKAGHDGGKTVH